MAYNMRDDIKEVYFTEEQLRDKVRELGARITEDYRGKNPLIVSVLKGSYIFMSDLTRAIDTPCNVDFMVVSSYGNGTKTSGEVQIIKDIAQPIDGRDLLIVEDILDSRNAALPHADPRRTRRELHPSVHAPVQAGAPQDRRQRRLSGL